MHEARKKWERNEDARVWESVKTQFVRFDHLFELSMLFVYELV